MDTTRAVLTRNARLRALAQAGATVAGQWEFRGSVVVAGYQTRPYFALELRCTACGATDATTTISTATLSDFEWAERHARHRLRARGCTHLAALRLAGDALRIYKLGLLAG